MTRKADSGYSGSFGIELSKESKENMAEWVRRLEADIAAKELREEDDENLGTAMDGLVDAFRSFSDTCRLATKNLQQVANAMRSFEVDADPDNH